LGETVHFQSGHFQVTKENWEEPAPGVVIRQNDRGVVVEDANLYDENFGGFGSKGRDGPYTARFRAKRKRRPGIGHNRPPGNPLKCRHLIGGAGPTGWAGVQPSGPPPFVCQAVRQAEQESPPWPTPERDRAEELEHLEWREKQLDRPTDPNAGPSASFARGILLEEKLQLLAQHIERRIQKLHCRRYKPTAALEAKRFPKLGKVATKLLPKEARRQTAAERRAELNVLVADYLARGSEIAICPPETTTAQLNKRKTKTKMGRPLIGKRPMTAAERKRRSRAKWKQPTPAAPLQLAKCPAPRLVPDRAVGAGFLIKDEA
jgi:hypothetical protein